MSVLQVTGPVGHVATLTLDRPEKRNALSIELRDQVSDGLDALSQDEDVRVVVLTGAGGTFSAGFDLSEFEVDDAGFQERLWASSDRFHRTVLTFPLPLVAAVDGPALAGGFDLAVMCDLRIATPTTRFSHPEQAWSDVVYGPLEALVGGAIARELAFTGREVGVEEALSLHLVNRVVPSDELEATVVEVAEQIARAPREVLLRMKAKALRRAGLTADARTLDL